MEEDLQLLNLFDKDIGAPVEISGMDMISDREPDWLIIAEDQSVVTLGTTFQASQAVSIRERLPVLM